MEHFICYNDVEFEADRRDFVEYVSTFLEVNAHARSAKTYDLFQRIAGFVSGKVHREFPNVLSPSWTYNITDIGFVGDKVQLKLRIEVDDPQLVADRYARSLKEKLRGSKQLQSTLDELRQECLRLEDKLRELTSAPPMTVPDGWCIMHKEKK